MEVRKCVSYTIAQMQLLTKKDFDLKLNLTILILVLTGVTVNISGIVDSGLWTIVLFVGAATALGFVSIFLGWLKLTPTALARFAAVAGLAMALLAAILLQRVWHLYDYDDLNDFIADVMPAFLRSQPSTASGATTHKNIHFELGANDDIRMAYAEYRETGLVHEELSDFVRRKDQYYPIVKLLLARMVPWKDKARSFHYAPFFGQQIHLVKNFCGREKYRLLSRAAFTDQPIIALMSPIELAAVNPDRLINTGSLAGAMEFGPVLKKSYRVPTFGFNNGDANGDGYTDIIIQNVLYIGGDCSNIRDISGFPHIQLNAESLFLNQSDGMLVASLDDARIPETVVFRKIRGIEAQLVSDFSTKPIERLGLIAVVGRLKDVSAYFVLNAIPDLDGDKSDELLVLQKKGFSVLFSSQKFSPLKASGVDIRSFIGTSAMLSNLKVGGFADYDGDGKFDFWLQGQRVDEGVVTPLAMLFSGGAVAEAARAGGESLLGKESLLVELEMAVSAVELPKLANGIGTFNPAFAQTVSLFESDFDGDGVTDTTFTSHYELGMSGTMYVIPGRLIRRSILLKKSTIRLDECEILGLRAPIAAKLATKPRHYSNHDLDQDGIADIIIAANGDYAVGHNAGAVYLISGQGIRSVMQKMRCDH